ncbi:ATP-binding protein [Sorangium sp. So ce296]|uniref:AAA family ATPase n=1 Tax=Sorangium sp. So ce296 TaxID=3133296 RepID=UPI003F63AF44
MTSYTASGARRTGDQYQDLQSAEVLIEWLEQQDAYHWVRLETMDGSLDDIQAERTDGTRRLLQVKFGTDAAVEWEWDHLTEQERGKKGPKPSLLQKWKTSFDNVVASGIAVSEAALLTNRAASAAIRAHLSDSGLVDFNGLSASLQATISAQLGGPAAASSFFASFHFFFKERSFEALDTALRQRFQRLGGTAEGWSSLMEKIRRWINRKDEPTSDGTITLADLRAAALWHLPSPIPQGFLVPEDYVAPKVWSDRVVEPRLRAGGESLLVVTGRPGTGKSTYLSWLVGHLRHADVPVVRHHYFLSTTDATPLRTDWKTAADAIIGQLRSSYEKLIRTADCQNPLPGTLREFLMAAGRERAGMAPLVVIVDGLDHVWRDTGSEEGLRQLFDLLLPAPDGVVVVVGTQDIDIARIPRKLRDLCSRDRWLEVSVLDGEGVHEWLKYHEHELGLPKDREHAYRVLDELADAFRDVSGGHPLVLHYTLSAARQGGATVRPDQVRALPNFDPNSSVATYYRALWEDISPEGHQLLHLLAGFHWAWPRDGLVRCLAPQADLVRLEQAERTIRHVLGNSRAGVTAFHESLLAFVQALPDHQTAAQSLRPQVVDWLTNRAPEYWRWRHEWEERAKNGETAPLISSATLDWCVDSLAAGRSRTEIADVVAASGWAALRARHLGVATERHYIDAYLEEAGSAEGVLSSLLWLALHNRDPRNRELELNLFLSRKARATEEEIEAVAEVAFSVGQNGICRELLRECSERWNTAARRTDQTGDRFASLEECLPSLIAASLTTPSEGAYQRHVSEHHDLPSWCSRGPYARALARLCVIGDTTSAIREELRFLANHADQVSFEAVDEIVRLACRDGFDPSRWLEDSEARRSGLFRCARLWGRGGPEPLHDTPREVSFLPVSQVRFGRDENTFIELARSYFFSCLACAAEGGEPAEAVGLDIRASAVRNFLSVLRNLAADAAASKKGDEAVGGAWLVARLAMIKPPEVKPNDYNDHLVRRGAVARIAVAIAQDLEELHIGETGRPSLTRDVVMAAIDGAWTWERIWIEDRVTRRLTMGDFQAGRLLMDRERARLEGSRDYLHTRAAEYASLAQFCQLHNGSSDEVHALARLAATNLLGHGYHKDITLFDVLAAILAAPDASKARSLARLRSISPIIQVVGEITDGDETRYLTRKLAGVVREIAPNALPPYLRALQREHHHWIVESCFTDLAKSAPLKTVYERALASTLVHEEALTALQERADSDDIEARSVLASTLAYCGRQAIPPKQSDARSEYSSEGSDKNPHLVEDYPPERLPEFVGELRDARIYGDEHLAAWTTHWRSKDPDGLLAALTTYRATHGYPHEKQTARSVVELAVERSGRRAAWDWLIAYHEVVYGWIWHIYPLSDVEWIWKFLRSRFRDQWLEFIAATSRPRWGAAGGAPRWSIERMVRFLPMVGEADRVDDVLDAAVRWGAGLAANMPLPAPALTPDRPELPVALRLLVDRLDCPSRMVQERAGASLAGLLANADTSDATMTALLDWHATEHVELRSCTLLMVLHLARTAHGMSPGACVAIARQAKLVPSVGADLLLREFRDDGEALAATYTFRKRHSGGPAAGFAGIDDFAYTVKAHLAPVFLRWANELNKYGIEFSRQWEWEAVVLARQQCLSLRANAYFDHHYRGGIDEPVLAINDRLSMLLRSAYLRALHWSIDEAALEVDLAEIHARRVAAMADPALWAVRPAERPDWWPGDPGEADELNALCEEVGWAIRNHLEKRDPDEREILLFAAGPVGNRPHFRANLTIRSFLQSAHGSMKPLQEEMEEMLWVGCQPIPPRLSLPGTYMTFEEYAFLIRDWMVAPLAWWLQPDAHAWLMPDLQARGLYMPATWLLPGSPTINIEPDQVSVTLGERRVARYRYWNDELRERRYIGANSRVGGELLVRREWLEPQLAAGATLCWLATLSITRGEEHKERFGEPQVVGTWVIGGSRFVWPEPWIPPKY